MSPAKRRGIREGRWGGFEARIQLDGKMRSRTFDTFEQAVAWRAEQERRRALGREVATGSDRMTFEDWWQIWQAGRIRRPNTLARDESAWRTYLKPRWARVPLGSIDRIDAQAWVRSLSEVHGLAPASVARVVHSAAAAMQAAVDDNRLERNPFRRLDLPDIEGNEARFCTIAEALAIEEVMDPWWSLTIPVLMDVGLRVSELCGLRVKDIAFAHPNWTVRVEQIVTTPHGHVQIGPPKTKAGIRTIPLLTPEVATRVAAQITARGLEPDDPLFSGKQGKFVLPTVWRTTVFTPAVKSAGLHDEHRPLTPHSLRHGAVARWIAAGLTDYYRLARWLGHASPATALVLYGHLLPEEDHSALAERLSLDRQNARASGKVRRLGNR